VTDPTLATPASARPDLVHKVELLISGLLRVGVVTSLVVILAGLALSFLHHGDYLHSHHALKGITSTDRPSWQTVRELREGIRHGRGEAVIMIGLLLLIATPVMRVAVSVVVFIVERDWKFVAITLFVLTMLILSFLLGKAES